jgi:hypothetical protein
MRKQALGLTFSHVTISGDCASLSGLLAGSTCWQTDKTDSFLQVGLSVQLENGDVVVEGLGIVVVVDVGRRHAEGLGTGTAELLGEVVITHTNVNCISSSDNANKFEKIMLI